MKDRVSTYPGRVRMTPVSGQTNVYDLERADQPTEEGTPLNKANLLSDAVAEFLDLPTTATPNDAFRALKARQNAILKYTDINTSGQWTVPSDLVGGKIFVIVVGGGGSGGGVNSSGYGGSDGGSGHLSFGTLSVTAGQVISAVIGAGASAATRGNNGTNGGTTTFGTLSAAGGSGGKLYGGDGGYGGAGGGGFSSGNGGNASFGGGGGTTGSGKKGGNGGPYGGGGYAGGSANVGKGGTYGGDGGSSSTYSEIGAPYEDSYEMWDLAAEYYGVEKIDRALNKGKKTTAVYLGGGGLGSCYPNTLPTSGAGGCGFLGFGTYYRNNSYGAGGGLFYSPLDTNNTTGGTGGFYSSGNSGLRGNGGSTAKAGGNGVVGIWYYATPTRYFNENI